MFDYDPVTKWQSKEWHKKSSPRPKKTQMSRSRVKTVILVFSTAVALCTKNLYLQDRQLITPSIKMSWNDFENGSSESEGTLHRNGCCNTITRQLILSFQFENFWRKKNIPVLPHPPYSPDLAPCDFYPFPKVEIEVEGSSFRDDGKHTKNCNRWTTHTYGKWLPILLWSVEKSCKHSVTSQGSYFEGDKL